MAFDWKDIPYGHFSDLSINRVLHSKSKRRRSLASDQQKFLNQHITPQAGRDKGAVPAVVYRTRQTKYKRSSDSFAMRSPETDEAEFKNYVYNVYYHGGASFPAPESLDDPRVPTLPEATLDPNALHSMSMFGNAANNFDLTSRMVMITFDHTQAQLGARITRVGTYVDLALFSDKLSKTFVAGSTGGGGSATVAGPSTYTAVPKAAKQGMVEFYQKLRASDWFKDYSREFLIGLTANANNESGGVVNATGDPREGGTGTRGIEVNGRAWCSFGYWQMNVCGEGYGGDQFATYFKIDVLATENRTAEGPLFKAITNEEKQFEFVAHKLTTIRDNHKPQSSVDWARLIAVKFERCTECGDIGNTSGKSTAQTQSRMNVAAGLETKIQ